jgi:hypothetical protein
MQTPNAAAADLTLWTILGEELDSAALPLPPRTPSVLAMEAVAFAVRDALEARLAATVLPPASRVSSAKVELTKAQRARVRALMVDEGQSRAAAVAWVLAFEPEMPSVAS